MPCLFLSVTSKVPNIPTGWQQKYLSAKTMVKIELLGASAATRPTDISFEGFRPLAKETNCSSSINSFSKATSDERD